MSTLLLGVCLFGATFGTTGQPSKRWNIVWITCEDMSPDLGCFGAADAHTPHLDRFAKQSCRFMSCFSVSGVCAPSRSALITGMYPSSLGTHHMRIQNPPPDFIPCFPALLRSAGYYCTNNVKQDYNFPCPDGVWDESSNKAHWRNRAAGQPFFAVFNLTVTHESQIRAAPAAFARQIREVLPAHRFRPEKAVLPPYYADTPAIRRDWANYRDLISAMDAQAGRLLAEIDDAGLAGDTIVFFFSDHGRGLPRAKRWLYDSGLHVPLMVRWPGRLAPGSIDGRLVSFVDFAPTVLALAGVGLPAHLQGQPFLGADVKPREFVFAARDRMDETYDLIRAVRDDRRKLIVNFQPEKPFAQIVAYGEEMPTMRELRRLHAEGKLNAVQRLWFADSKPLLELYDTKADPHEVRNLLAGEASKDDRAIADRMLRQLIREMFRIRDLGLLPESEIRRRDAPRKLDSAGRLLDSRWNDATQRKLLAMRGLKVEGSPDDGAGFRVQVEDFGRSLPGPPGVEATADADPVVRYWAAYGFARQSAGDRAVDDALRRLLKDETACVRVAAAAALIRRGAADAAWKTMDDELRSADPAIRVMALNEISLLDAVDPRWRPTIESLLASDDDYTVRKAKQVRARLGGNGS